VARSAAIQGDVLFEISGPDLRLADGNPILAKTAQDNLETWTLPPLERGKYLVRVHFVLVGGTRKVMVPVGNKLDRFFLRLFHAQTEKARTIVDCDSVGTRKTDIRQTALRDGDDYVIEVFATNMVKCFSAYVSHL
jgi:hypothetical protein